MLSGHHTQTDAELLLDWSHFRAYHDLSQNCARHNRHWAGIGTPRDPTHFNQYRGMCGFYAATVNQMFNELGISACRKNMAALNGDRLGHAVSLVHFATDTGPKSYLVDHTLAQFFPHGDTRQWTPQLDKTYQHERIAERFCANEESFAMASQMLTRGWVEATDDNLIAYTTPFANAGRRAVQPVTADVLAFMRDNFSDSRGPKALSISPYTPSRFQVDYPDYRFVG